MSHSRYDVFGYGTLLPAYSSKRGQEVISQYSGVDSDDSDSYEAGAKFMDALVALKSQPRAHEHPSAEQLQLRLEELMIQYPAYSQQLKTTAYQAGIFESKNTIAYDPGMNRFFSQTDSITADKLPAEVAAFIKSMQIYAEQCQQSKHSIIQP